MNQTAKSVQVEDDRQDFEMQRQNDILTMAQDENLFKNSCDLTFASDQYNYSYMWNWLGVPIIQMPADILALQEIIWKHQPEIIVETGIARGGSVIFYASMLRLLGRGKVIAIDIDIRPHNREVIENHLFSENIELIEGSSIDSEKFAEIESSIPKNSSVMVVLDSNHTHEHVRQELELYSSLVTPGQYLVVADTVVEHIPEQQHRPRPWGPGDNPLTAVEDFLNCNQVFVKDPFVNGKMLLSSNPGGYLKRIAE